MVLELFLLLTWMLFFLGLFLISHGFSWIGWVFSGFVGLLNLKMVIFPAVWHWFSVEDVESLTFKYYQNLKKHRFPDHPVVHAFAAPKIEWIVSKLRLQGRTVLDVGGGNGYFTQYLMKECQAHVLDISEEQLKLNPLPADRKHHGSVYKLPFPDGHFDVVFASNLLHHLNRPDIAMKEITRVAKSYVVIVEASNANPFMRLGALVAAHECRSRFHSKEVVQKLITDAGLEVTDHTYQGGVLLPNRSFAFTIPFSMVRSFNRWISYYQIFISKKVESK